MTLGAIFFGLGRIAARSILLRTSGVAHSGRSFGASNALGLVMTAVAIPVVSKIVEAQSIQMGFLALSLILAAGTLVSVLMLMMEKSSPFKESIAVS